MVQVQGICGARVGQRKSFEGIFGDGESPRTRRVVGWAIRGLRTTFAEAIQHPAEFVQSGRGLGDFFMQRDANGIGNEVCGPRGHGGTGQFQTICPLRWGPCADIGPCQSKRVLGGSGEHSDARFGTDDVVLQGKEHGRRSHGRPGQKWTSFAHGTQSSSQYTNATANATCNLPRGLQSNFDAFLKQGDFFWNAAAEGGTGSVGLKTVTFHLRSPISPGFSLTTAFDRGIVSHRGASGAGPGLWVVRVHECFLNDSANHSAPCGTFSRLHG